MFQKSIDRRKREGDDRPAPTKTGPRIWDMLCNHFFRLLWANILCVICSLPIVTIPAALSGLFAVVQQYYRKGYGDVNSTFLQEFKQDFLIRIAITLGLVILPVAGWLLGTVFSDRIALVVCALFSVLSLLTIGWLFPQLALLKLRPMEALRNAFLLSCLESKRNLLLLVVEVLFGGVMLVMWPLSFILLLFLIPVYPVIFIHVITEPVIEERIIGKAEQEELSVQE